MVPEKPLTLVKLKVKLPEFPRLIVIDPGMEMIVKSGEGALTIRTKSMRLCVIFPLVAPNARV
jgi:hypothetical protein